MNEKIKFHQEYFQDPHAAVNVKVHFLPSAHFMEKYFLKFWSREKYEIYIENLFNELAESFWQTDVQDIAKSCGFDGAYSEGRSSGWAVPYFKENGRDRFLTPANIEGHLRYKDFLKFRDSVLNYINGIDKVVKELLIDEWYELEEKFLHRHSVFTRTLANA